MPPLLGTALATGERVGTPDGVAYGGSTGEEWHLGAALPASASISRKRCRCIANMLRLAGDCAATDARAGVACRQAILVATLAKVVSACVQNNRPTDDSSRTCTRRQRDAGSQCTPPRAESLLSQSDHSEAGLAQKTHRKAASGCQ